MKTIFVALAALFISFNLQAGNPPAEANSEKIAGKIEEKIDASNYTYLRLKSDSGETWVAVPRAEVKKGDSVKLVNPMPMNGFESKTLKRKFDKIYFGVLEGQEGDGKNIPAQKTAQKKNPHGAEPMPGGGFHDMDMSKADKSGMKMPERTKKPELPKDFKNLKITKAEGSDGKTVAEIFAGKPGLKDKTVSVRGKVTKANSGIMGKNWLHLSDGSGSTEKGDFDLTVTTAQDAKVGDTIVATGKVMYEKKLDPYFFPAIIEDAKISK